MPERNAEIVAMPLDRIRAAERLIRERAEGATPGGPRWETAPDEMHGPSQSVVYPADSDSAVAFAAADDAEHIATWHPAVALTVADWLHTAGADLWAHGPLCVCGTGCDACDDNPWEPHARAALALADLVIPPVPPNQGGEDHG